MYNSETTNSNNDRDNRHMILLKKRSRTNTPSWLGFVGRSKHTNIDIICNL
ncbi:hypothetical protein Hdeb2414_s0765g00944401 [Helianthus debilis subsp. tardiflorus]